MFLQPDGTFFIQLANFAIFFALLNVLFLRPVGKAIRERREYVNSVVSDYDTYQAEANALRAQAEETRAAARRDAEQTIAKARAEASNTTAELGSRATAQVHAIVEEAHRIVAGELEAARTNESQLVRDLAELMLDRAISGATK